MAKLVLLYMTTNAVEGELLRGRLEAEGISVLVKGEAEGPYRLGPLYLWVSEDDEIRAREVLAEIERGELSIDEDDEMPALDGNGTQPE